MHVDQLDAAQRAQALVQAESDYQALLAQGLSLDLTRGKPSAEQANLSNALDGILDGNYFAQDGTDVRNYGGIDGLPEAKALFAQVLQVPADEMLIGGNASLTLMYQVIDFALRFGFHKAWNTGDSTPKFLCPVPGYDRHFSICEYLGIEMVTLPMLDDGPDMDVAEALVQELDNVCGIWCVPRFSNPTGCVYSEATLARLAALPKLAKSDFLIMYDNAYAVHALTADAPALGNIREYAIAAGTLDNIVQFGSTSKITFAGAGVAFLSTSKPNLAAFKQHLGFQTIGPDKVNQLRHVAFFKDHSGLMAHMDRHADIMKPRFDSVLSTLESQLGGTGMGSWISPEGGYFVSFETRPGLAKAVIQLASDAGIKLTPAGATFPYGNDPQDSNIRIAPSFPSIADVQATMDAFVVCVRLATLRSLAK